MKKNILITYSLLVLPLITSSALLSMEWGTNIDFGSDQEQIPNSQNHFLNELRESRIFKDKAKLNTSTVKDDSESLDMDIPPLFEFETIKLPLPDCMAAKPNITKEQPSTLSNQTIIVEKVKREPTFGEKLTYYTSTHHQLKNNILSLIEKGEFKVGDEVHETWLAVAIKNAINKENIDFLIDFAALCHKNENYRNSLRISEELSQQAFEKLQPYYTTQLSIAEEALQKKQQEKVNQWNTIVSTCKNKTNDAFNVFNQEVKELHDNYDQSVKQETEQIDGLREKMKTFSFLNKAIKPTTTKLLDNNQIQTPRDLFVATMKDAQGRLNFAQQELTNMPTIKERKVAPQYQIELASK